MTHKTVPIDKLLDAAFQVLQHDTGPDDPEYRHARDALKKLFSKILKQGKAAKPDNTVQKLREQVAELQKQIEGLKLDLHHATRS